MSNLKIGETIKSTADWIIERLLYPFKHDLPYFIFLWFITGADPIYEQIQFRLFGRACFIALLYYLLAYIITVLLNVSQTIGKIFKPIVLSISACFLIFNTYLSLVHHCRLSLNIVEVLANTNPNEIKEYAQMYFSFKTIAIFTLSFSVIILTYILTKKIKDDYYKKLYIIPSIGLLFAICAMCYFPTLIREEFITQNTVTWVKHQMMVGMRKHIAQPKISFCENNTLPANVITIIGESFSLFHSSLYGYDKQTNPLLKEMYDDGDLIVFNRVTSPATMTIAVFTYILNTRKLGMENECEWYESPTVIDVMNSANYHTVWLSNQEQFAYIDNLPSRNSKLCDDFVFTTEDADGNKFDGALTDIDICDSNRHNAVFYHLNGQHFVFSERYPKEYDIFQPYEYKDQQGDVKIIAQYDNATLYNDYVVSSIINKYKDTDAIVFYVPDHGLDIYYTDPKYCGHATAAPESQAICKKIPFMVYLSPLYQQLRPELTERIKSSIDNEFCTDKLIYAVMDAARLKFADNDDVAIYSIFSKH